MTDRTGRVCTSHGMEILWETVPQSRAVSLGFFFPSGSRDDPPGKNGTAHFVEHMLFKGTRTYSAGALAKAIDRLGGDLNAYTDREEMAFHCTVPAPYWKQAADILYELCFEATFPESEIEKERAVIQSEILSSLEDPEELSYESFYRFSYPEQPYGLPVAGTHDSLKKITRADLTDWAQVHLNQGQCCLAVSGPLTSQEVLSWAEEKTSTGDNHRPLRPLLQDQLQKPFLQSVRENFQTTQVVGGFCFPQVKTLPQALMLQWFSLLWGETMSSRLFQNIREDRGLCYSISSQVTEENSVSMLHFFSSCAPERAGELIQALKDEVNHLVVSPAEEEWESARLALLGGLVLGSERMENRMQRLVQNYWTFGQIYTLDSIEQTVSSLSSQEAWRLLQTSLKQPSLLVWGSWKQGRKLQLDRFWE